MRLGEIEDEPCQSLYAPCVFCVTRDTFRWYRVVGTTGAVADPCGYTSPADGDIGHDRGAAGDDGDARSITYCGSVPSDDFIQSQYLTSSHGMNIPGNVDVSNLKVSMSDWYTKDRENPMPSEIKVTTWQNMPYSGYRKHADGMYEGTGYAFELLKLIQSKLNFTYTLTPPKLPIVGNKDTGVMKQLLKKEVDLAVAFIPVLASYQEMCSFSGTLDEVEITFMMERPRESAVGSGLLAPFNDTVWICILVALIVVGPVIYVLIYIRSRVSARGNPEGYPLSTCIWFTYGALLKQGSTVTPVTDSARLLFATWWIFITILTSFYTANLTAFLTLSEFTLPFTSLEDIMNKHQKWVTFKYDNVDNILKMTHDTDVLVAPLKKSLKDHNGDLIPYYNQDKYVDFETVTKTVYEKPVKLFLGEKYFFEDLIFNDYRNKTLGKLVESKRCTLVMLPQNLFVNTRAFAYPQNSPIAEHIDRQLRNLVETGIVKHLKKEALPSVQYCPLNLKSTERRLRNTDLKMTYYCVGVGFVLSIVAFVGEMIYRLVQLRKGFSCGSCCARMCCRSKLKSAVLPVYKHDPRPNFLRHKMSPLNGSPYDGQMAEQQEINGRDYWVIREQDGDRRLVPIRSPSALLFQYTSYSEVPNSKSDIPKF